MGGTVALAIGGSNQSLFLIGAIIVAQGSAAVPLLIVGLLVSWAATPGWIELVLMWPGRVGGIAATCAEAFRPYNPVLANLTGVCYWWGWVPTCGLTAILSAAALREWYLPGASVPLTATGIVLLFTVVNLMGVRAAARVAKPLALASALLALLSALLPVLAGHVDWQRASSFHLELPFHGTFGVVTSAMAGLYLIGFAAPAFEAATCHVGETIDPNRNVPRAVYASAAMASLYFVVLPVVWLGALGAGPLGGELMSTLGPTFAPLLGGAAKAAAIWFMVLNMFHGTLQPLAGASRTLSQLSDDGLLPRLVGRRSGRDVRWRRSSRLGRRSSSCRWAIPCGSSPRPTSATSSASACPASRCSCCAATNPTARGHIARRAGRSCSASGQPRCGCSRRCWALSSSDCRPSWPAWAWPTRARCSTRGVGSTIAAEAARQGWCARCTSSSPARWCWSWPSTAPATCWPSRTSTRDRPS